jgi:two-component system cell cycle response regulator
MDTPNDAPPPPEGRRLLLVGRDAEERLFLKDALEARGYRVVATAPGEGVWQALHGLEPQIVLMDLQPGLIDPLEDLVRIKEMVSAEAFVPVLAIFPDKERTTIVRAFQSGIDDFLVRPFEHFELVLRLEVLWRMRSLQEQLLVSNRRLHALSITDDLTGLCNQGEFKRRMELELRRVNRFGIPLACIFFDCDRFKSVNDTHGHMMGSHVIKEVARILVANLRETDVLCRYGGDEFVIGLPGCDLDAGIATAERLRALVELSTFRLGDAEVRCTLSMGVTAAHVGETVDLGTLLERADEALYDAKEGGRNRVCARAAVAMKESP